MAKLAVGGVAGAIGTCAIFPIDMVKTQLQNQVKTQHGTAHSAPSAGH